MTKDKVTVVWKCKARYLHSMRQSSRTLSFPDEKKRFIKLKNWHWEVFNKLQTQKGWRKQELENAAYQVAIRHHPEKGRDFEEFVQQRVSLLIKVDMAYVMKENGDWISSNYIYQ